MEHKSLIQTLCSIFCFVNCALLHVLLVSGAVVMSDSNGASGSTSNSSINSEPSASSTTSSAAVANDDVASDDFRQCFRRVDKSLNKCEWIEAHPRVRVQISVHQLCYTWRGCPKRIYLIAVELSVCLSACYLQRHAFALPACTLQRCGCAILCSGFDVG